MPKNTRNKLDDEYDKANKKRMDELKYANKVASKYAKDHYPNKRSGNYEYQVGSPEYSVAADAARRHYRKTHKNESMIFDNIDLI